MLESFLWANDRLNLRASATVLTRDAGTFEKKVPHLAEHPALRFHNGDVRKFTFPRERFDYIIHASNEAADYGRGEEEAPAKVKEAIVQAAGHTLDFARVCGARNFLFTSSGSVYGPPPANMTHVAETYEGVRDLAKFRFAHGEGKFIAEALCAAYGEKHGIAAKIARCFTFVGPYMELDANYAIGNFIRDGLKGGPIIIQGDGTACRSYMYAADLAIWLWTILFKGESCRPYNVGSEMPTTILELAEKIAGEFDPPLGVHVLGKTLAGVASDRYLPDITRAQAELRLNQFIYLESAIRKTLNWQKLKR